MSVNYTIIEEPSNPEISNLIFNELKAFNLQFFRQKYESVELDSFVIHVKDENSKR